VDIIASVTRQDASRRRAAVFDANVAGRTIRRETARRVLVRRTGGLKTFGQGTARARGPRRLGPLAGRPSGARRPLDGVHAGDAVRPT